jgi:hypothetical protein
MALVASEGDADVKDRVVRHALLAGASIAIVVAACGGQMSETEYVEGLNDLVVTAGSDLEAAYVAYEQIEDPTIADLVARIDRELAVEYAVRKKFEALDPPDSIAEVHRIMVDTLARLIDAAEGVVAVADTVGSLEEAEQTPEFAEYLAVNADADGICLDLQAEINDLAADSEGFGAGPWVTDLRLTVRAFLDCD